MNAPGPVAVTEIFAARRRLQPYLRPTPLSPSAWLSSIAKSSVHLKLESVQLTNSFKIRGALNAALRLIERRRGRPLPLVVTVSAGNHGRALALAGERLGLQVIVYTPKAAPETKKAAIRRHGAELRDDSPTYDAADQAARAFAADAGALYLSPYNDPDVIAGAGTVALEILESLPALDTVIVPIGGGGLLSGVGLAMKAAAPRIRVVGVEAAASTAFTVSLARGEITEIEVHDSIADGLTGNLEPRSITFPIVRDVVDAIVSVDEAALTHAVRGLAAEEHVIAEGAGAAATAAIVAGHVASGGQVVAIVSGGNIDLGRLRAVLAGKPIR
jgi:threonine dehydratase